MSILDWFRKAKPAKSDATNPQPSSAFPVIPQAAPLDDPNVVTLNLQPSTTLVAEHKKAFVDSYTQLKALQGELQSHADGLVNEYKAALQALKEEYESAMNNIREHQQQLEISATSFKSAIESIEHWFTGTDEPAPMSPESEQDAALIAALDNMGKELAAPAPVEPAAMQVAPTKIKK